MDKWEQRICVIPEDDHFDSVRLIFYMLPLDGHGMEYQAEDSDSFHVLGNKIVYKDCQVHGEFGDDKLPKHGITAEGRFHR